MSKAHQIKQYLRYRGKAKNRHGVHSPFVYELTDKVLKKGALPDSNLILATSKHKKLVNKLIAHFGCRHILWITNREGETETFISIEQTGNNQVKLKTERFDFEHSENYPQPDLYLLDLDDANDVLQAWEKYKERIQPDNIVMVTSIHHSKDHTVAWNMICDDYVVKLSLDLYKVGLLFFREEFKEKQHFFLKYST